jgi:general secretion pathway protein A
MYATFYGLAKKPFSMTPDPAFLFMTEQHREALSGLVYAILERKGYLVLSGVAGCGKTTLLAWVMGNLPRNQVQSALILNPTLTREEFLEMAMLDFGMQEIPDSKARRLWELRSFLLKGQREGLINVLIVDEAHKLSVELLEEIRLLGNLELGPDKLIQILLVGQPELDDVLNKPELWQLKQRVSVRLALKALSPAEIAKYIEHRWTLAEGKLPTPFSTEAVEAIGKWSTGIPRLINSLCDNTLLTAFADEAKTVMVRHVEVAARDLGLQAKVAAPAATAATAAVLRPAPAAAASEPAPKAIEAHVAVAASMPQKKKSIFGRWVIRRPARRNSKP